MKLEAIVLFVILIGTIVAFEHKESERIEDYIDGANDVNQYIIDCLEDKYSGGCMGGYASSSFCITNIGNNMCVVKKNESGRRVTNAILDGFCKEYY